MIWRKQWISTILPLAISASLFAAETAPSVPTAEQVATWIRALDDENYSAREQAVARLVAAGRVAIGPVAKAMLSESPEAAWRASDVLEQIGISGNEQTLELVSQALEEVSRSGKVSLVKSKSEVQRRWKTLRHDRAVAQISSFGGKVHGDGGPGEGVVFLGGGMAFGGFEGMVPAVEIVEVLEAVEIEAKVMPAKFGVPLKVLEGKPVEAEKLPSDELKPLAEPIPEPALPIKPRDDAEAKVLEPSFEDPAPPKADFFGKMFRALRDSVPPLIPLGGIGEADEAAPIVLDGIRLIEDVEVVEAADFADAAVAFDMVDFEMVEGQGAYRIEIGKDWKGGVEGLGLLKDVIHLALVELRDFDVTEAHVEQLGKIAQIKQLSLQRCRFDRAAIEKLKKSRPELSVLTFGEAVMGISGDTQGEGFRVTFVAPNSGAHVAGIQIDDVIKSIDGEEVPTFERLTHLIAAHQIGDKLPIELVREGKPRKVEVTLQARPAAMP